MYKYKCWPLSYIWRLCGVESQEKQNNQKKKNAKLLEKKWTNQDSKVSTKEGMQSNTNSHETTTKTQMSI